MPCPGTLRKSMASLEVRPGMCPRLVELFAIKTQSMTEQEKVTSVLMDEVALRSELWYNPHTDEIEGYEDLGHLGRTNKVATHALVFMLRGIFCNWKQPLCYLLTCGPCKAVIIESFLIEVIKTTVRIGLTPKVLIADQGTNNQSLYKRLGIQPSKPYFHVGDLRIVALFDPPHLLKSIRNNFKNHGFIINEIIISWKYIYDFYKLDSKLQVRMARKLLLKHVILPAFSHLGVAMAAQVLSHSVATGIKTLVKQKLMPATAIPSADFCEKFDQLFNAFNSHSLTSSQTMKHALSANSGHLVFLQTMLEWLEVVKARNKSGNLPCLSGWKLTIAGTLQVIILNVISFSMKRHKFNT